MCGIYSAYFSQNLKRSRRLRGTKYVMHCSRTPRTPLAMPHNQPVCESQHWDGKCQQHYEQGGCTGVHAVWTRLTTPPTINLVRRTGLGSGMHVKLDVTYNYHQGNLCPSQVGALAYVIALVAEDNYVIICIEIVLPMVWVDSPKLFCAFTEMLKYMAISLLEHFSRYLGTTSYPISQRQGWYCLTSRIVGNLKLDFSLGS